MARALLVISSSLGSVGIVDGSLQLCISAHPRKSSANLWALNIRYTAPYSLVAREAVEKQRSAWVDKPPWAKALLLLWPNLAHSYVKSLTIASVATLIFEPGSRHDMIGVSISPLNHFLRPAGLIVSAIQVSFLVG